MSDVAGIVLAGGRSTRMGAAKADLEWHGGTLLRRVVGLVARAVGGQVLVVAAVGQVLPPLPPYVRVVADPEEGAGPLVAVMTGLAAAAPTPAAFVCATDMPFLHPAVIRRVVAGLVTGVDVAMPVAHGRRQPLAAAYRTALAGEIGRWVDAGERRLTAVAERRPVALLSAADLLADPAVAAADPALRSLTNLNRPADYDAALAVPLPEVTVEVRAGPAAPSASHRLRAATVGRAVALVGLAPPECVIHVDGRQVDDGGAPLAEGDTVTVLVPRTAPAG